MNTEEALVVANNLWTFFNERRWDEARELLAEEFEAYWPQSNEKIPTPNKFIQVNREYPGTHEIQVISQHSSFDRWEMVAHVSTEVFIRSMNLEGKEVSLFAVSFFEIQDGKIRCLKEYWADTYPAPEWRKHLVEQCDQTSMLALEYR